MKLLGAGTEHLPLEPFVLPLEAKIVRKEMVVAFGGFFQPLTVEHVPVPVPKQDFNPVPAFGNKKEKMAGEWVEPECIADDGGQSIEAAARIHGGVAEVDGNRRGQARHGATPMSNERSATTVSASR